MFSSHTFRISFPLIALAAACGVEPTEEDVAEAPIVSSTAPAPATTYTSPEQLTVKQTSDLRSAVRVVAAAPVRLSHVGAVTPKTFQVSSEPSFVAQDLIDAVVATADPRFVSNQRKVAVRINDGLTDVGHDVVPVIADFAGIDSFDLPRQTLASGTLGIVNSACKKFKFEIRNLHLELPVGSSSVRGHFQSSNGVEATFDLPSAEVHATLDFEITRNPDNPWICVTDVTPLVDYEADVTIGNFDGTIEATFEKSGDAIQIKRIDRLDVALQDFSWDTNSWLLNTVLDIGFSLYDLFSTSCSGQASCVTKIVNDILDSDDDVVDSLTALVNDAIDVPLSLSEGVSNEGFAIEVGVGLSSIHTSASQDTMTSEWDVDLSSAGASDPCAAGLEVASFIVEGSPGDAALTSNDLEVEIPFHLVSEAVYYAGKQGAFCHSFMQRIGTRDRLVSVTPNGAVGVSGGDAGDPQNTVKLSIPIQATVQGSGGVTATLVIEGELDTSCSEGVKLVTRSVDMTSIAGSLTVFGVTVTGTALEAAMRAALAAGVPSELPEVQLLEKVTSLGGLGSLTISPGTVTRSGSAFVLGLSFGACN